MNHQIFKVSWGGLLIWISRWHPFRHAESWFRKPPSRDVVAALNDPHSFLTPAFEKNLGCWVWMTASHPPTRRLSPNTLGTLSEQLAVCTQRGFTTSLPSCFGEESNVGYSCLAMSWICWVSHKIWMLLHSGLIKHDCLPFGEEPS